MADGTLSSLERNVNRLAEYVEDLKLENRRLKALNTQLIEENTRLKHEINGLELERRIRKIELEVEEQSRLRNERK